MFDSFDEEPASKTSNFNKKNSNVRKNTKKFGFKECKQNFDIEDDDNDINEKLENSLTSLNGCLFNRTDLKGENKKNIHFMTDFRNEKVSINQKEKNLLFINYFLYFKLTKKNQIAQLEDATGSLYYILIYYLYREYI